MDARTQILDVATRRFAAHGYGGTSLSAIADEVGIRKASLLYHFASKEELHRAVLEQVVDRWSSVLPRLLAAGPERFDALLSETVRFFSEDPDRARLVLRETLDQPDAMRERLRVAVAPWLEAIAGFVRRAQERGEVRADADPEAYLLHVVHLVVGGIAISDTLGIVLGKRGAAARMTRELERIAKVSLFTPEGLEKMNVRRAGARAGSH